MQDERGALSFFEIGEGKQVPFQVKRMYYLYALNELERGFHAHKELKQLMICLQGSCSVILDNGNERHQVNLSKPNQGLFVNKMTWREIRDIANGTVILVLASEHYEESDYIRSYEAFLGAVKKDADFIEL